MCQAQSWVFVSGYGTSMVISIYPPKADWEWGGAGVHREANRQRTRGSPQPQAKPQTLNCPLSEAGQPSVILQMKLEGRCNLSRVYW